MPLLSSGFILVLILIFGFIAATLLLDRFDLLEPYSFEAYGPFLMWKTKRGKGLIERLSKKKKFWKNFANLGLVIVAVAMVLIFLLVALSAYMATQVLAEEAPQATPQVTEVLAIPGVNPFLPLWYGILSLAVAIIVHEFSHAILSRVGEVDVKSLGLIFLVIPIGAFAEPDEDQLEEVDTLKRSRIYAAGPTSNMVLAIIAVLIFSTLFMGSISPREEGVVVDQIIVDTPAAESDMQPAEQVLSIGDENISGPDDLYSIDIDPGERVDVQTLRGDDYRNHTITAGLVVVGVLEGYPADDAGLRTGDIMTAIETDPIKNQSNLTEVIDGKEPGDTIDLTYLRMEDGEYDQENTTAMELTERDGSAYMGVRSVYMGFTGWEIEKFPQLLSQPYAEADSLSEYIQSSMEYASLPFLDLYPLPEDIAQLYTIEGGLSVLPTSLFWIISNSLYWIFLLNLLVGLFNSLPAVPLDGGFMFKDGLKGLMNKFEIGEELSEKISSGIAYIVALSILFMLMWPLIVLYL